MSTYDPNFPRTAGLDPTLLESSSHGASPSYNPQAQADVPADATFILSPKHKPSFAWLVIVKGSRLGQLFEVKEAGSKIGRRGKCDILLSQDESVSSEHAKVYKEGDHFVVHDLASANGTFVNGQQVYHHPLKDNDSITIGRTVLVFKQLREVDLNG
ncbi:MAG: FHA domain-containing protein [Ardenticatenaceae bacterium]